MIWRVAAVLVALIAVAGANVLLLTFGSNHNDPVGRLRPIAHVGLESPQRASPPAVIGRQRHEDD
jgi:hypothetical protein